MTNKDDSLIKRGSIWGIALGIFFLIVFIVFISLNFGDLKKFITLVEESEPLWLVLGIIIQILTYVCAGAVWHAIAKTANRHLPMTSLARLSVEQLTVNQFIPSGDVAGNVIIVRAMKRFGLPNALAMEVLFIDTLAYQIAFGVVALISLLILWIYNHITLIIIGLVSVFFLSKAIITFVIWAIVNHRKLKLPGWVRKLKIISQMLEATSSVSNEKIFSLKLLLETSFFRFAIFVLDGATLYVVMRAIGIQPNPTIAFTAVIIGTMAGAVTFLPGGIGGFEAASIGILKLLGMPLEAAVTGTLLYRGLTLWIPLIPGLVMARHDLLFKKSEGGTPPSEV
jgi:uncharacterized protein (TIRG00374 family)